MYSGYIFIVLVADKGRGMQFASAMNIFSLVQELSLIWFIFRFLGLVESDKINSIAPFTLWLFMMAFISMSTNITVTAFKRG